MSYYPRADLALSDDLTVTDNITLGGDVVLDRSSADNLRLATGDTFTADDIVVVDDLSVGDDLNLTSTGAVITIGPAATDPVVITHSANTLTLAAGDSLVAPIVAGGRRTYTTPTTLVAADSGALCVFSTAAGQLYTLPAAVAGLNFEFVVDTTCTSGVHRVACASGDFLFGSILQGQDTTFSFVPVTANGSSHLAWEGNGSTTGGIIGDHFTVTAIDATKWQVWGINNATGTEATPFKTS